MKILVTGCAGFIGFHLCKKLIKDKKFQIFGIDNLNNYYDSGLKKNRLKILLDYSSNFKFYKIDIANSESVINNFKKNKYDVVINLAAQAGVRHSIKKPRDYVNSNLLGFFNILDASKNIDVKHFLFASQIINYPWYSVRIY